MPLPFVKFVKVSRWLNEKQWMAYCAKINVERSKAKEEWDLALMYESYPVDRFIKDVPLMRMDIRVDDRCIQSGDIIDIFALDCT